MTANNIQRRIYSISELTADIKALLEQNFPFIWITGEISNYRVPGSGHFYFTLKDERTQISAVIFRAQNRNLTFAPENGMSVTGLGRIGVYEPRGTYQVILEYLEPAGVGAIQVAFEQLKVRLAEEGLFDEKHKRSLPFLPNKISVVTSPTGAVIHDIIKILDRRFSNLPIEIVPTKVQGDGAEKEIVSALELLNARGNTGVIILARGGGSLEDLHAFNAERVARAIFASKIPVISAVGHETDFSIADFVADLRAPTPSAAAELVVPLKRDLSRKCAELSMLLSTRLHRHIEYLQVLTADLAARLSDPRKKVEDLRLCIDDLTARLVRTFTNHLVIRYERLHWRMESLRKNNPLITINKINEKLEQHTYNLFIFIKIYVDKRRSLLRELSARLHSLSPAAILDRGYSITRIFPEGTVVRDPDMVDIGQDLELMIAKGALFCSVKGKDKL